MDSNKSVRIVLKFKVQNIPGDPPSRRANVLADAFMEQHFQREFRFGRDWMHVPCNIDSARGSAVLFLDVNAKSDPDVTADNVPLQCYLAEPGPNSLDRQDGVAPESQVESLRFQATHLFNIKHYSSMFPWGGKKASQDKHPYGTPYTVFKVSNCVGALLFVDSIIVASSAQPLFSLAFTQQRSLVATGATTEGKRINTRGTEHVERGLDVITAPTLIPAVEPDREVRSNHSCSEE